MRYTAHRLLIDPARGGAHSGLHLFGGCGIILAVSYFLTLLFFQTAFTLSASFGVDLSGPEVFRGNNPASMFALLFSFAGWLLAVWAALALVHQRSFGPVLGPMILFGPQFINTLKALLILNLALAVLPPWGLPLPDDAAVQRNMGTWMWLALLPLSLLAVLIQVSAEEILFRGYLQQQLAARWSHPALWMVLPSLLFGLAHYDADAGRNAWAIASWAVVFGLLMADLTARAGSLGPAIAVHFINNVMAMLLIGVPDSLGGLALFHYPAGLEDEAMVRALLPIDFALMLISWLAARIALRR